MKRRVYSLLVAVISFLFRPALYFIWAVKGVVRSRWERLFKDFVYDFFYYNKTTLKEKVWAYRRGFLSERIHRYSLSANNVHDYMPDVMFYQKNMYKNRRFNYWYDDKLTTWYILQAFSELLPEHYYSIIDNNLCCLTHKHKVCDNTIDGVLSLLRQKGELACKKVKGGHGGGFVKLSYSDEKYYMNNHLRSSEAIKEFLTSINEYLITEYVYSHKELRRIYAETPSVLRMVTVYDKDEHAVLTGSLIRFGTRQAGLITDVEGSILCGVDIDTGKMFKPMMDMGFYLEVCPQHPNSGQEISGLIPNWDFLKTKIIEISNYLNNTPYLTYDVVVTEQGFKILEINSHAITRILQPFYPFFQNPYSRKLFLGNNS